MAVEIRVPPLGESVVEATVGRWTKKEGDSVARDEILVELETDKITVEVAAQAAGTLGAIQKNEGDTVGVNELLATLEAADGASPADAAGQTASARFEEKAPAEQPAAAPAEAAAAGGSADAQTSPAVRALVAEHGLDVAQIRGTGPNGRVTKEDVLKVIEDGRARTAQPAAAPAQQPAAPAQQQPTAQQAPAQPAQQPSIGLHLTAPYPYAVQGVLELSFVSTVFTNDPAVQFASGGRTVNFTIPANTTQALFNGNSPTIALQTGTTAGDIVIEPSFTMQNGFDLTPSSPQTLTLSIGRSAPRLLSGTITSQTLTGFTLELSGYSTTRSVRQLDVQITPRSGDSFSTTRLTIDVTSASSTWFQGTTSQAFGGAFLIGIPFSLQNGSSTDDLVRRIQSLNITAANEVGTSEAMTVAIP